MHLVIGRGFWKGPINYGSVSPFPPPPPPLVLLYGKISQGISVTFVKNKQKSSVLVRAKLAAEAEK